MTLRLLVMTRISVAWGGRYALVDALVDGDASQTQAGADDGLLEGARGAATTLQLHVLPSDRVGSEHRERPSGPRRTVARRSLQGQNKSTRHTSTSEGKGSVVTQDRKRKPKEVFGGTWVKVKAERFEEEFAKHGMPWIARKVINSVGSVGNEVMTIGQQGDILAVRNEASVINGLVKLPPIWGDNRNVTVGGVPVSSTNLDGTQTTNQATWGNAEHTVLHIETINSRDGALPLLKWTVDDSDQLLITMGEMQITYSRIAGAFGAVANTVT